jgi:dipeptidyl aminopeptidase/acylaminoacyl peptidase
MQRMTHFMGIVKTRREYSPLPALALRRRLRQICLFSGFWLLAGLWPASAGAATAPAASGIGGKPPPAVQRRLVNDGQLVLEGIPAIPDGLAASLERFQQLHSSQFAAFNNHSQGLFISRLYQGVEQLHYLAEPGAIAQPVTRFSEPVREVQQQPGTSWLALTMDQGGSGFEQIYLHHPDSGETRLLTDGQSLNNRMVWDASGQRLAWRSTARDGSSNDIWLLDIAQPERARMVLEAPAGGALWKPVSFSRDGRRLLVQQYQDITDSRIHVLELDSGQLRELVGLAGQPSGNVAIGFDASDEGVFFVSNKRGKSAEIGWVGLSSEAPRRYVQKPLQWDINEFELSADGKRGAFITNEDGISRLYLFNPRRFTWRPLPRVPVGVISGLRFSADGRRLGMTISTPASPADSYVLKLGRFNNALATARPWTDAQQAQKMTGAAAPEPVIPSLFRYASPGRNGSPDLNIPGFAYLPPGEGPFPVVIYIHGDPESQFRPAWNSMVQMWAAQMGVAVLAPNVRGSLGYGLGYLSLDDGRLREDAVHDIGALLDTIQQSPLLDASRVAVFGASYGGYMALASAVHFSDRLVAAVNRAGISNFVSYLENTQDYRRDLRRGEYGDERDPAMREFLQSISPLTNAGRVKVPVLMVHGQNDAVVPASESEQMVDALRQQGQTVWFMNALNEGHLYEKKANEDVYQQVTYMFLQRYLLAP